MEINGFSQYIFQPNLQELAVDENLSLSLKLQIGQKCLAYDCGDNNLFIAIYEEFKFFKGNAKFNRFRKRINFQMFFDFLLSGLYNQSNKRQLNKVTEIIIFYS